jgi:Mg2+-importing ATPase
MDKQNPPGFWSQPLPGLMQQLNTGPEGLTAETARRNLEINGPNLLRAGKKTGSATLLLAQFKSPIILILIFAAILSIFLGDGVDAAIILTIVTISGLLGFWQERGANDAIEKLLSIVQIQVTVVRGGQTVKIPFEQVVPGDITLLTAGATIPGDCLLVEGQDLFVDEAALTGETYPVEKKPGQLAAATPLAQRTNSLFMGTHVVSGTAKALVVQTGKGTEFGKISERLRLRPPETEFERGIRHFGYLLMEVTFTMLLAIFAINVILNRPALDSFLFSLALAVGLTPQLLPAIISINLAQGARRMARHRVIVKRLSSIENFGSMNVLCSDKTGTLTEGRVELKTALDAGGQASQKVQLYAFLNASYESGYLNPVDEAICAAQQFDLSGYAKLDEIPYDFIRKRLSILVNTPDGPLLITKGAFQNVLDVCDRVEMADGHRADLAAQKADLQARFDNLCDQGYRTLGLAYRTFESPVTLTKETEAGLVFCGFLAFSDPPKAGINQTITDLAQLGINLKVITGDSLAVAKHLGQEIGLAQAKTLTGLQLEKMSPAALAQQADLTDIFAEIEPNQKERIIIALKKTGNVVGYMGDGINDASALHAADVGISVDRAVDVAKEAADIILLDKDLNVLLEGVKQGRITFANTLKYVFMATSANFGNMFSMAGASLFLSFLPMLPKQILLTNLLTDFPETAIATDNVDPEMTARPRRWNIKFIYKFMLTFGPISSIFDFLTFGSLLLILNSDPAQFRAGWFVESVLSASLVVLVIRTQGRFYRSKPGKGLFLVTVVVDLITLALPYTPLAGLLGFAALPPLYFVLLVIILGLYLTAAELAKSFFYKKNPL